MFEIITTIAFAFAAIISPIKPEANYVYTAKASSLNDAVLFVEKVPETPPLKIALTENEGEKIPGDDFGISEGLKLNPVRENEEKKAIEGWIKQYSAQYSVSYEEMSRVMQCESSGKIDAVGDNGKAFGLFQFWENTFNLFAKDLGENLEWKNPEHQIKLASWAFSRGKQTHWSCWKNISR